MWVLVTIEWALVKGAAARVVAFDGRDVRGIGSLVRGTLWRSA
jgi:hypothetical protein